MCSTDICNLTMLIFDHTATGEQEYMFETKKTNRSLIICSSVQLSYGSQITMRQFFLAISVRDPPLPSLRVCIPCSIGRIITQTIGGRFVCQQFLRDTYHSITIELVDLHSLTHFYTDTLKHSLTNHCIKYHIFPTQLIGIFIVSMSVKFFLSAIITIVVQFTYYLRFELCLAPNLVCCFSFL